MNKIFFLIYVFFFIPFFSLEAQPPPYADKHFCIVTIPKSGSHLVEKCMEKISGKKGRLVFSLEQLYEKNNREFFPWTHFHQDNVVRHLLHRPKIKCLFHVRDLRDVVMARFDAFSRQKTVERQRLSPEDCLAAFLGKYRRIPNCLLEVLAAKGFLSYFDKSSIYISCFEKLVGPEGGGSRETQIEEILNIAAFIEVPLTRAEAEEIGKSLFGGTKTFRKGQIGGWKNHFSEEHKNLFKRHFGDLLVQLGYEKNHDW